MNNFDKFSNALRERSAEEVLCNVLQQDEEKRRKRCSLVDVRPGCTRKDTHERCSSISSRSRSLQPFLLNSPIVAIIKKNLYRRLFPEDSLEDSPKDSPEDSPEDSQTFKRRDLSDPNSKIKASNKFEGKRFSSIGPFLQSVHNDRL